MMEARLGDRVRDRQLAVDDVDDHLQHCGNDSAAAGRAGDEKRLAVLEHDGGRHRRERALARSRRVGVAADETIGIGRAGLGGEVVELVVEQDAGALGDETETVAEVERVVLATALPKRSTTEKCVVLSPSRAGAKIEPKIAAAAARAGSMRARTDSAKRLDVR